MHNVCTNNQGENVNVRQGATINVVMWGVAKKSVQEWAITGMKGKVCITANVSGYGGRGVGRGPGSRAANVWGNGEVCVVVGVRQAWVKGER